jgi:hypothetical protein
MPNMVKQPGFFLLLLVFAAAMLAAIARAQYVPPCEGNKNCQVPIQCYTSVPIRAASALESGPWPPSVVASHPRGLAQFLNIIITVIPSSPCLALPLLSSFSSILSHTCAVCAERNCLDQSFPDSQVALALLSPRPWPCFSSPALPSLDPHSKNSPFPTPHIQNHNPMRM